ncbi:MAG: hypothetical protein U0T56_01525 [Ferruginibacter sp.]
MRRHQRNLHGFTGEWRQLNPAYQWFNGANLIAGDFLYVSSTLVNGDVISVQLTSNETCATSNPATSNSITMTVNPNLPVSIGISAVLAIRSAMEQA